MSMRATLRGVPRSLQMIARYLAHRVRATRLTAALPLDVALDCIHESMRGERSGALHDLASSIAIAESIAGRAFARSNTCLDRALARWSLLVEHGYDATFVLGAPTAGAPGHAWVEVDGAPFMERGVPRFARVLEFPPAACDRPRS